MRLARLGVDDPRWRAAWEAWDERDPFAHPAFARLFAAPGETPFALLGEGPGGAVLFPLVERTVPGTAERDLGNPYGYGGPFALGAPDAAEFWREARAWLAGEGYVSLFARLSLGDEHLALAAGSDGIGAGDVVETQPNVVRTLGLAPEALWADYDHTTRYNVRRGQRAGLTVEFDETGAELDAFAEIYAETMERNAASAYYRFPKEVFTALVREMPGAFVFPHARKAGRIVSTELTLRSRGTLWSFLGGTRGDAFGDRPNHLLKHELIRWGGERRYARYVLGGGVATPENGGEDGIYRYKLAFAPSGRRMFRTLRLTLDLAASARLAAARGPGFAPRPGFFPAYRA